MSNVTIYLSFLLVCSITWSVNARTVLLEKMSYKDACGRTGLMNATDANERHGRQILDTLSDLWSRLWSSGDYDDADVSEDIALSEFGEWPWQVSFMHWREGSFYHKCGAALLTDNWVATAAHCLDGVHPEDVLLRMGEYDTENHFPEPYTTQDRDVQIVALHPDYDPISLSNDLVLLRFKEPVRFQPNIVPICIPADDEDHAGETGWVTGWGRLFQDGPFPPVLKELDLPILNNTECEASFKRAGYWEEIPDIFICAGYRDGRKDTCEGDSGGPMAVLRQDGRYELAGILSWGIGCGQRNRPGVYTRVSTFRDWVNHVLQNVTELPGN
eukprot:GFUD01086752.1.p1 GENE.GFUD01086752.1~~GFUD01086752.1.p1  ORF type:complete len:329 (+),score=88.38 GFUD01086752.1:160-1146(+)